MCVYVCFYLWVLCVCVCVCLCGSVRVLAAGGGLRSETSRAQVRVDQTPQNGEVLPYEREGCSGATQGGAREVLPYRVPCRRTNAAPARRCFSIWFAASHTPGTCTNDSRARVLTLTPSVRRSLPPSLPRRSPRALLPSRTCTCAFGQVAGASLVQIDMVRATWLGYSYSTCGGHMVLEYSATCVA